jgi:hypothetical protein
MKLRLADFRGPPKSLGDYLCLADAADLIGTRIVPKWKKSCLDKLADESGMLVALDRAEEVRDWLITLLSGGMVKAFGKDHEGRYFTLERDRLSAPFFQIDILRSEFLWMPEEWDVIFVSKTDLEARLSALRPSKPRETVLYDWREISCLAWRLALDDLNLRKASRLMAAVKLQYSLKTDQAPDDKDLRDLVNDIVDHLGNRVLSRGGSAEKAPREVPPDSA